MLFEKGDWVWYVDEKGAHFLPVGSGMPCIPISPRWTTGPGLLITEKGLVQSGPSIYSTLALATSDNHICVDYKGHEYIYLTSFKQKYLSKRFGCHNLSIGDMIRRSTIYQLNLDFDHYGFETKRRLDRDTIHFIKKWLEDQPMKAKDKPKSVTTTLKVSSDERGIVSLEDVTNKIPIWKLIRNETTIVDGKKRITRVNKWKIVGYREPNAPPIIKKPPFVYKVTRATPTKGTWDVTKTTWPKMAPQIYRFADELEKKDVGIKTFNAVYCGLKKHLDDEYLKDNRIVIRLAELRFLKYPRSRFTLRKYAKILNRMRTWKVMRKVVAS